MKRIKSFLTIIMAAIFALSLVPAGAFATTTPDSGNMEDTTTSTDSIGLTQHEGRITIANAKQNETYETYRIFDLASFRDSDNVTGEHPEPTHVSENGVTEYEAYSYVIKQSSSWYNFLIRNGPKGVVSGTTYTTDSYPYAVTSDEYVTLDAGVKLLIYFVIDNEAVSLTPTGGTKVNDYHVVTAQAAFSNAWDTANSTSSRTDAEGNAPSDNGNPNYSQTNSNANYNVIQDFAQAALAYAKANHIAPNYTETASAYNDLVINSTDDSNDTTEQNGSSKVPLGYYLVGTSMGSLAALDTTNRNVSIYEKNDEPKIDKKVRKKSKPINETSPTAASLTGDDTGDSATWVEDTDADINDLVQFRTVVTAQQGAKDYLLHDVMERGLEFVHQTDAPDGTVADRYTGATNYDVKVYFVQDSDVYQVQATDSSANSNGKTMTNWVLRTDTSGQNDARLNNDGCDFEVKFYDADSTNGEYTGKANDYDVTFLARKLDGGSFSTTANWVEVKDGDKIVVTYWARVHPNAAVWGSEATDATTSSVPVNDVAANPASVTAIGGDPKSVANGNGRNDNHTVLTYGAKAHTVWDKASVTTYELDIAKTSEKGTNGTNATNNEHPLLGGATFSLYKAYPASDGYNTGTSSVNAGFTQFFPNGVTDAANAFYYKEGEKLKFVREGASYAPNATNNGTNGYQGNHVGYQFDGDSSANSGVTSDLVSGDDKAIHVYGLEAGTYILVEEKAPNGFNKLAHPIVITITGDTDGDGLVSGDNGYNDNENINGYDADEGNLTSLFSPNSGAAASTTTGTWKAIVKNGASGSANLYDSDDNGGVLVVNQAGQELPSTGGIGTTIFYVAGTVLVVGAAVMLVAKRRMGSEA